jgi:hypothetical protein
MVASWLNQVSNNFVSPLNILRWLVAVVLDVDSAVMVNYP